MDVTIEKKFQANIRGADGLIAAVVYDEGIVRLIEGAEGMREALRRIAFEPQGHSEAAHAEVLDAVAGIARAALERAEG